MANPNFFEKSVSDAEDLLTKTILVREGKTPTEAGIDMRFLEAFGLIAERVEREQRWKTRPYPFQAGGAACSYIGGFFDNKDWPLRMRLARQQSMFAVAEHEAKYVNAAGYWSVVVETAMKLRQEALTAGKAEEARLFDAWIYVANRYVLRVLGLRAEFYRMAAENPGEAKNKLLVLEKRGEQAMSDDLEKPLAAFDSHYLTKLMKAVATQKASNATKRAKGKGGAADDN